MTVESKHGKGPVLPAGNAKGAARQGSDLRVFTQENGGKAVLLGIHQTLQIGDQMVEASAESTA